MLWVQVEFADTSIVITEPYFNFTSIQESMNEILFEEYQFQSALRINGESHWTLNNSRVRQHFLLRFFTVITQSIYSHRPSRCGATVQIVKHMKVIQNPSQKKEEKMISGHSAQHLQPLPTKTNCFRNCRR